MLCEPVPMLRAWQIKKAEKLRRTPLVDNQNKSPHSRTKDPHTLREYAFFQRGRYIGESYGDSCLGKAGIRVAPLMGKRVCIAKGGHMLRSVLIVALVLGVGARGSIDNGYSNF